MILKVLPLAALLLLELSLANCQWYGYDSGLGGQQYVIVNPYSAGYDEYSHYSYPSTYDPQYYGYAQPAQYSAQPIVIIVNNDRDMDCDVDDFLSLIFPVEDKCYKEPVYIPYPVPVDFHDRCECKKCECTCRCECYDSCSSRSRDDCQCKKKKERNNKKCNCNECPKHSCNCGGLYHKM